MATNTNAGLLRWHKHVNVNIAALMLTSCSIHVISEAASYLLLPCAAETCPHTAFQPRGQGLLWEDQHEQQPFLSCQCPN